MLNSLKSRIVILVLCFWAVCQWAAGQSFPEKEGERVYYDFSMRRSDMELSGICILLCSGDTVKASIVNNFGATLIDYSYDTKKLKIKLHYVFEKLDKWYIRRVLKRNLKKIMLAMRSGENSYKDVRHKLSYTFILNFQRFDITI